MKCAQCQAPLLPTDQFCGECGAPVDAGSPPAAEASPPAGTGAAATPSPSPGKSKWIVPGLIVLVLVAAGIYVLASGFFSRDQAGDERGGVEAGSLTEMSSDTGEQTISSSDDREKPPSREIAPPAGRDDEDDAGVLEPEDLIVLEGEDLPEDLKQEILEQLRSEEDLDEAEVRALEALLMKEEADGRDIFTMDEDAPASEGELFVIVEQMPELLGGGLSAVERQVRYPAEARAAGISGRVFVQFVVDEQGDVVDPHVVQGIGAGCDEEALRVVRGLKFNPGRQRGQPVKVQMLLPITFQAPR